MNHRPCYPSVTVDVVDVQQYPIVVVFVLANVKKSLFPREEAEVI